MTVIWQDRLCKIDADGTWMMSAVGEHDNWDFMPLEVGPGCAIAGNLETAKWVKGKFVCKGERRCVHLWPIDDERLLFVRADGAVLVLTGNPMAGGQFDRLYILGETKGPFGRPF